MYIDYTGTRRTASFYLASCTQDARRFPATGPRGSPLRQPADPMLHGVTVGVARDTLGLASLAKPSLSTSAAPRALDARAKRGRSVRSALPHRRRRGAGSMGTVFRALDTYSGETVGLKILHRISLSGDGRTAFNARASILAGLRHPGIARYVDHGLCLTGKPISPWSGWRRDPGPATRGPRPLAGREPTLPPAPSPWLWLPRTGRASCTAISSRAISSCARGRRPRRGARLRAGAQRTGLAGGDQHRNGGGDS